MSRTQNLCPQQMWRARANVEAFVSATLRPQQYVLFCQGFWTKDKLPIIYYSNGNIFFKRECVKKKGFLKPFFLTHSRLKNNWFRVRRQKKLADSLLKHVIGLKTGLPLGKGSIFIMFFHSNFCLTGRLLN